MYNYLFYKAYQAGKRSGNFEDMPILAGIIWVGLCLVLNFFSLYFLLKKWGILSFVLESKYKYIFSFGLVLLLIAYYTIGNRYKLIIEKYENMERLYGKSINPILVVYLYLIMSFLIGTLCAMYKNGDGLFK
jgi:hypothetical protein